MKSIMNGLLKINGEKMKKAKFYSLRYTPDTETKSERVEETGYLIDDDVAVYHNNECWWLIDIATGTSLGFYEKRKDAVDAYSKMDMSEIRQKEYYKKAIERFNASPIKEDSECI